MMRFEFYPNKDRINTAKHGVALVIASALNWDAALLWIDTRRDYGETRVVALVPLADTLYYIAFVDRGAVRRIISARRANRREIRRYVQTIEESIDPDA